MKLAIYSHHQFEKKFIEKANTNNYELCFTDKKLSTDTTDFAEGCKVVLLFSSDKANSNVLHKLKDLGVTLIATRSAGTDHIDLDSAEELGIRVVNVPSYSPNAIAEHCIALTLALFRKLKTTFGRLNNYNFNLDGQIGTEINGKVFGICGTGDIGEILARIANGFGAEVLLFDAEKNPDLDTKSWAKYTDKETLLKQSDIVSLNLPLNESTSNFISGEELNLMKSSAILINTGRGGLVETKAVKKALENNDLAGFGMDVYENEKGIFYNDLSDTAQKDDLLVSLINMDQVIVTAHQAFLTDTALSNMMQSLFDSIEAFDNGNNLKNAVVSDD